MRQNQLPNFKKYDALIVGAGFAGLYMLHRLRKMGLKARVIEAGGDVGGTWYWNRYPGARCDIESMEYSYQFDEQLQQEWEWTERYATQPEILSYINHVADRFDLRNDITFNTRVISVVYDELKNDWTITTNKDEIIRAQFCIMATGCLSVPNEPKFEGLDSFKGNYYLTARWPHEGVDFSGLRVGVVGTGSSGIQSIPEIAKQAAHLTVFQRRPTYSVPAQNQPLEPNKVQSIKANYSQFRRENSEKTFGTRIPPLRPSAIEADATMRKKVYENAWKTGGLAFAATFADLMQDEASNQTAAEFLREKIHEIVEDPKVAQRLTPDYIAFCRRLCVDTDYFATYNRSNVDLVDISENPIEKITPAGLVTNGKEYPLDAIVFALGFDAMTGALLRIDIRGRTGRSLREKWKDGPKTYLGLAVEGFPNLFTITGPGSPSVLSNMIPSIEQHVNWIAEAITHLRNNKLSTMEASAKAEGAWVRHAAMKANATLFRSCGSYYDGANVPGKPRVFMPYLGYPDYVKKCEDIVRNGYRGFDLR